MDGFWVAFGVIFVAELGDKSQLMALAFSTRFSAWRVLIGITIATAITHAVSVGIGEVVGNHLPTRWLNLVAGLAFLGFAWWTWRGDTLDEDDEEAAAGSGATSAWRAVLAIGVTFFLAELGDKTMLATITLATKEPWFAVWLGFDHRHGRRRCARHRRRPAARVSPAGAGDQDRCDASRSSASARCS